MSLEACISDAITATEVLFWAIHREILSAYPTCPDDATVAAQSTAPSYGEIKNLAYHLSMLSGHLRSLQLHCQSLPRDLTNASGPTVSALNTNFKQHSTDTQKNQDAQSKTASSHLHFDDSESSFDLIRLRTWTAEFKQLRGEILTAADKPGCLNVASETCSIATWPSSIEETKRVVEMVTKANGLVPQFIMKTQARKSLLRLLSSYTADSSLPSGGEIIQQLQLRSPFENPELLDAMFMAHPRAEEIFSSALSWVCELDAAFVITLGQLCDAVALHLCPDARSMSELGVVTEHQLLQICGDYLRIGRDGSLTTASREVMTQTIPSHLRTGLIGLAHVFLRVLSFAEFDQPLKEVALQEAYRKHRNDVHPLYLLSAHRLPDLLRKISPLEDQGIQGLLHHLFDATKSNNFTQFVLELLRLRFPTTFESFGSVKYHVVKELTDLLANPTLSPLHISACLGLPAICEGLIQQGEDVDLVSPIGAPFYCALVGPGLLVLGSGSINMKVVSDGSFSVEPVKTAETIRRILGTIHVGVSERKKSLLAAALFTSTQNEDLDFFTSVVTNTGLARRYVHSLCEALNDPGLIDHPGGSGMVRELPASTRHYFDGVCSFLIDETSSMILDSEDNDNSHLQPLEEAAWELATKLNLPCSESDTHRPCSFLDDNQYRHAVEATSRAVVIADKVPILSVKRLLQDPRSLSVWSSLPPTPVDSDQTLLHSAVERRSIQLIDLLIGYAPGVSLSAKDVLGRTPLHLCDNVRVLKALVRHKVDLSATDNTGRTVWHNAAANNDKHLLEALLLLDPAKDVALTVRTQRGTAPLAEAFLYVRELTGYEHANDLMANVQKVTGSIRLLAEYSNGRPDCWESSVSLLHLAAEWGLSLLVHKLHGIGYRPPKDHVIVDGSSPLHSLNFSATSHLVKLLRPGKMYEWSEEESFPVFDKQQRSPAEAIFFNFHPALHNGDRNAHPSHYKDLDQSAYRALLTREVIESRDKNGTTLWERFIANVFGHFSASSQMWILIAPSAIIALQCLLEEGAMAYHEKATETSGLLPLLSVLPHIMWDTRRQVSLENKVVPLIDGIITQTRLFGMVKTQQEVTSILTWAVGARRVGRDQETADNERLNLVLHLLERGVSAHAIDKNHFSALAAALIEPSIHRADLHRIFRHVDADKVNLASHNGRTALELLCLNGDITTSETATILPDLDYRIMILVRAGADPNMRDSRGWPLVLSLAAENKTRSAQILIESGANVASKSTEDGYDVAIFAVSHGKVGFLEWLQRQAISGFAWDNGCIVQHRIRASSSDQDIHAISGCTGLHVAALRGYLHIVKFYLKHGYVDVDCRSADRQLTPLHLAALGGHMEVIGHLAAKGADPMAQDVNGATPLFYAVWAQEPGSVRKLLELGAAPEHKDFHGRTTVSEASKDGNSEVCRLLSEAVQARV